MNGLLRDSPYVYCGRLGRNTQVTPRHRQVRGPSEVSHIQVLLQWGLSAQVESVHCVLSRSKKGEIIPRFRTVESMSPVLTRDDATKSHLDSRWMANWSLATKKSKAKKKKMNSSANFVKQDNFESPIT